MLSFLLMTSVGPDTSDLVYQHSTRGLVLLTCLLKVLNTVRTFLSLSPLSWAELNTPHLSFVIDIKSPSLTVALARQ